ncbi:hypothetical protein 44RRORF087c [Aeromonas phage 44RR2.8t]|uniref:Uncharacterized protein n=2 Tax=Biquartavirus 44RR2 TaxID=115987 RepID=Q6U9L5_9CAUD|nr:hypothetical protein ST44RRORF087c [Aeromonas phage 44RR2.8t]AAQ81406.1 hypothetical protein 44RRORF087c [Aeromonas phage 44RR2.8t]APU00558.1 hypothetical protein [Aeromonas phage 44RR2.8t.2]
MNIQKEIQEIEKRLGVEASEFKMPSVWKVARKPDWSYGAVFEQEFTAYEHKELGCFVAVYSERHRAQFVNTEGEDVIGHTERVVSVQHVEPYKTRLGTSWRVVNA